MITISSAFYRSVEEIKERIRSGSISKAEKLSKKLFLKIDKESKSPLTKKGDVLSHVGCVALAVMEENKEMAIPWLIQACHLAAMIDPYSEDTAWDFFYLGECFENSGQLEDAAFALDTAKYLNKYHTNDVLKEKIRKKISALNAKSYAPNDSVTIPTKWFRLINEWLKDET